MFGKMPGYEARDAVINRVESSMLESSDPEEWAAKLFSKVGLSVAQALSQEELLWWLASADKISVHSLRQAKVYNRYIAAFRVLLEGSAHLWAATPNEAGEAPVINPIIE